MRRICVCVLFSAGLVFAAMVDRGGSQGPVSRMAMASPSSQAAGSELHTHLTAGTDGQPLVLTVVDPREQWIGVYHVDRASGEINLKSARKITWDEQLVEFHTGKPLPQELRSALPR